MSNKEIALRLTETAYAFINTFKVPLSKQEEYKEKVKADYLSNLTFVQDQIQDKQ